MKYTVIFERGENSYGAFVPDLPGCIAAGVTKEEALDLIKEAIEFHIEGLKDEGEIIPTPYCDFVHVEVDVDGVILGRNPRNATFIIGHK